MFLCGVGLAVIRQPLAVVGGCRAAKSCLSVRPLFFVRRVAIFVVIIMKKAPFCIKQSRLATRISAVPSARFAGPAPLAFCLDARLNRPHLFYWVWRQIPHVESEAACGGVNGEPPRYQNQLVAWFDSSD